METMNWNGDHDRQAIEQLEREWRTDRRWAGIERPYSAADVVRLRATLLAEHPLARRGAERLWHLLQTEPFIRTFGALTGNQAVQMVQAGLKAIYVSGWQVAGDMNNALQTYPDQSLYPADSVPTLIRRLNNALTRVDQITHSEGRSHAMPYWYAPIVADGEAGRGGPPLATPRPDAHSANLPPSDVDEADRRFITGERSPEGFFYVASGLEPAIARGLAYAPYPDM